MAQINPQFAEIGQQFVQHYYQTFDTNRQALMPLYMEQFAGFVSPAFRLRLEASGANSSTEIRYDLFAHYGDEMFFVCPALCNSLS